MNGRRQSYKLAGKRNNAQLSRRVLAGLGALILTGGLSACGNNAQKNFDDSALTEVSFINEGALTVCADIPYEPFVFKEDGQYGGFDVDLVKEIADELGVKLKIVDSLGLEDITTGEVLNDGLCDMAASAITITGSRARVIDFSSPYFDARQVMLTTKGSDLPSIEALAGKRVGVKSETAGETYVRDYAPDDTKIVSYGDSAILEDALIEGGVDAIVLDNVISASVLNRNPQLRVAAEFDTGEQYGMAVRKDGNVPLLRKINNALAELRETGRYDEIYNQYF